MKRVGTAPTVASTLTRALIPGLSMAFASSANVAIMRRNEWQTEGVDVVDEDGVVRGRSKVAGWMSLQMCATARILWNIPCMMAPIVSTLVMHRVAFLRARPIFTDTFMCGIALSVGVAPALAYYPKHICVPVTSLEPEFHHLIRRRDGGGGDEVQELRFYKGL
jgi:sideroflexin-5